VISWEKKILKNFFFSCNLFIDGYYAGCKNCKAMVGFSVFLSDFVFCSVEEVIIS